MTWKNRIVGSGEEAPDQLMANPLNWRTHPKFQQDALQDVLEQVGVVQQVIVNRVTGHLVDGHLRVSLAMRNGAGAIPVTYVELTEEEERKILATFDPFAMMATTDAEKLGELLAEVGETEGTLGDMLRDLAAQGGVGAPVVDFKEYGDDAAKDVQHVECPSCGHVFPK